MSPRTGRVCPVHRGPRSPSRERLTEEPPERRSRAPNLTAVEEQWRGDEGEPQRLQEGAVEGRTQPGDGEERSAEEALGGVGVVDSEASD
jgi:hypothetical protein